MNMLYFLQLEILWNYALGYEKIDKNDKGYTTLKALKDFAKICAIPTLDKATSTPDRRPVDDDYIKTYIAMNEALLILIEQASKQQHISLSLSNIVSLAKKLYPNDDNLAFLLDQSFTPGVSKPFNQYGDLLNDQNYVITCVKNWANAIFNCIHTYGIQSIKNMIGLKNNYQNGLKK